MRLTSYPEKYSTHPRRARGRKNKLTGENSFRLRRKTKMKESTRDISS
jgi:hypothetical protein